MRSKIGSNGPEVAQRQRMLQLRRLAQGTFDIDTIAVIAHASPMRVVRGMAAGFRRVAFGTVLAGLLLHVAARADKPQWAYQTFPFAQAMNVEAAYEVTHSAPERLISTIHRWGVDVRLVRSETPTRPLNPILAGLPPAAPELVRQADFRDTHEGRVVCSSSKCCGLGRDTILIRDTALNYTLIHEFVQSLLRPLCQGDADDTVEARFGAAFRRLMLYQRRLYDDPYKLLDPLWRRDILEAQADVAGDLFGRIRLGQSQEAIVEKLLSLYIDEHNPYFDADRRTQGLWYAEAMINNAIDMFNALNDSVVFVENAVLTLRQSMRDGNIQPRQGIALTDDDLASVALAARGVEVHLAVVRTELQVLKQFFGR